MILNALHWALTGGNKEPTPYQPTREQIEFYSRSPPEHPPHPDGPLPKNPPAHPSSQDPRMILVGCLTLLCAVVLISIYGSKETAIIALATLLPLTAMMYNQWRVAQKSDEARHRLEWEIRQTKHDIKDDVNYVALLLKDKELQGSQFRDLIKIISEEVRKAEREQFWTDEKQREQLKGIIEEILAKALDASCAKIAQQSIKAYHEQYLAGPKDI